MNSMQFGICPSFIKNLQKKKLSFIHDRLWKYKVLLVPIHSVESGRATALIRNFKMYCGVINK